MEEVLLNATEEANAKGRMITGRQLLWLVYNEHKVDARLGFLFDITDLVAVKYDGDLARFKIKWDYAVTGQMEPLSDTQLESILYKKLCPVDDLRTSMHYYWQLDAGHPDKNYAYLYKMMRKTIELHNMDRERLAISVSNGSKTGVSSAACPLTCCPSGGVGAAEGQVGAYQQSVDTPPGLSGAGKARQKQPAMTVASPSGDPLRDRCFSDGICYHFNTGTGTCPRMQKTGACKFLHVRCPGNPNVPPAMAAASRTRTEAKAKSKGTGLTDRRGVLLKDKPCWAFKEGKCTLGDACRFRHDQADLAATGSVGASTPSY